MAFKFEQGPGLLLGSEKAIADLAEKKSARLLVISDSHGASDNVLYALLEKGAECDALVFCGDGISDLAALLGRVKVDSEVKKALPSVIAMVEGNNDCDLYPFRNPDYSEKKGNDYFIQLKIPLKNTFTAAGHKVFLTHGHRYSLYSGLDGLGMEAVKEKASLLFYGHTHIALASWYGNTLLFNPGSIARPRGGQKNCYAIVNLQKGSDNIDYTFYSLGWPESSPYIPKVSF